MMRYWASLVLLVACGCSDTPTAPTPPPPSPVQLAGLWTGTFESQTYSSQAMTMELGQVGNTITGTWAMSTSVLARGNVTGVVDTTTFTGTVTFNLPTPNAPICTASFTGASTRTTIEWSSAGFATGNCGLTAPGNPLGVRFVLQRR